MPLPTFFISFWGVDNYPLSIRNLSWPSLVKGHKPTNGSFMGLVFTLYISSLMPPPLANLSWDSTSIVSSHYTSYQSHRNCLGLNQGKTLVQVPKTKQIASFVPKHSKSFLIAPGTLSYSLLTS